MFDFFYYYGYGYFSYLIFMLPALVISLWAQISVKSTLYYRVVVIRAPLQGLCYTERDAVDW